MNGRPSRLAQTDVLRIRVRIADLPDLRRAARICGIAGLENFLTEVIESHLASFRAAKFEPASMRPPCDERDLEVMRNADVQAHREKLSAQDQKRVKNLRPLLSEAELAKRFSCSSSTIRRVLNLSSQDEQ